MNDAYRRTIALLPKGDASSGEIELLRDDAEIEAARAHASERLASLALPEAWSSVGEVFRDQYISVCRDAVRFPSGRSGTYLRIVPADRPVTPVGVQAVLWTGSAYVLVRNYRHATRRWEWAFPRGFLPEGVLPAEQAVREAREEFGTIVVHDRRLLGSVAPDSGLLATSVEHWLLTVELPRGFSEVGVAAEEHEAIRGARLLRPAEFWVGVAAGDLQDGITLAGFLLAEAVSRVG